MKLTPNPDNPRTISKEAFEQLKGKIQRNPDGLSANKIVYKDGIIIAGNQRFRALQELKIELKDEWLKDVSGWTDEQIREYLVTSNISDGDWNWDTLLNEYDPQELGGWGLEVPDWKDETEVEEDEAPEVGGGNAVSVLGTVYQLGRHRVMCGDSTDFGQVSDLMDGAEPHMIYNDPPYGMFLNADFSDMKNSLRFAKDKGFTGGKKYDDVIGDHDDFNPAFITTVFELFPSCKEVIMWGANYYSELLPDRNKGSWFVWDKRLDDSADKMYGSTFELAWSKKKHKQDTVRVKWAGVFGTEKEFDHKRHHPTQKPVELSAWFVNKFSEAQNIVLDLFLGSGSTLIACEQTDRTCYGMELDPKYVDVIRKRYHKFINNGNEEGWEDATPAVTN